MSCSVFVDDTKRIGSCSNEKSPHKEGIVVLNYFLSILLYSEGLASKAVAFLISVLLVR